MLPHPRTASQTPNTPPELSGRLSGKNAKKRTHRKNFNSNKSKEIPRKTANPRWVRFPQSQLPQPVSQVIPNPKTTSSPVPLPPTPEPSARASNSSARSNSPAPATPHPSAARPGIPMHSRRSSSGPYCPHPDPSCSYRIPPASRQPESSQIPKFEETFFLSSTKTLVVINKTHVAAPNLSSVTQPMEKSLDETLHMGALLQLRNCASAQNCRSNRWHS